jgi:hypothetical protein
MQFKHSILILIVIIVVVLGISGCTGTTSDAPTVKATSLDSATDYLTHTPKFIETYQDDLTVRISDGAGGSGGWGATVVFNYEFKGKDGLTHTAQVFWYGGDEVDSAVMDGNWNLVNDKPLMP